MNPGHQTSNYGWALWHLEQAKDSLSTQAALVHATCAQARATLARIDESSGRFEGSTWAGEPS